MQPAHDPKQLFTIGHSNQPLEAFLELLGRHRIAVLGDVRSQPYSRYARQFDQPSLRRAVGENGIRYAYLGAELGGRPRGDEFYDEEGHALYGRVAEAPFFARGLRQVEQETSTCRIALLCSEENPLDCHRSLLIARVLAGRGFSIQHIRGDGSIQSESELEAERALARPAGRQLSLFAATGPTLPSEEAVWRSTRSVLQRDQPPRSSERSKSIESRD